MTVLKYEHEKLIERIVYLDEVPEEASAYASWIGARRHLAFVQDNAQENELAIYTSGAYTFIYAAVVGKDVLSSLTPDDLLHWDSTPFSPRASYVCVGGPAVVRIEGDSSPRDAKTLEDARQLVFGRTFEGWEGEGESYFEILQEYAHLTGIHWRPEQNAYCRFDGNGDLERVVSITSKKEGGSDATLVSFKREPLEQYLAASNSVLVRRFDFTLYRHPPAGWPEGPEAIFDEDEDFFYRQKGAGNAAYTCGVQIIRPSRPKGEILSSIPGSWSGRRDRQYVEFKAHDWRNKRISVISTDPSATTNYFEADKNSLPFELSPAFFRSEVLAKYKANRDKYTVNAREIRCRNAWVLRRYDVNEAGQVHAYVCDLRELPHQEQRYWESFNEEPRARISERALRHDFKGEMVLIADPLDVVRSIIRRWAESGWEWWKLREEVLIERISTPHMGTKDEWAEAFMDLSKLVIEGFEVKAIRASLTKASLPFDKEDGSLNLIEKFFGSRCESAEPQRLEGLRTVQNIRSKVRGHYGGDGGEDAARLVKSFVPRREELILLVLFILAWE